MKIAFIVPSLEAKGPTIFTHNLITGLIKYGIYCEIFYFKDSKNKISFPTKTTKISFWRVEPFKDFDIVHSTMAEADCYLSVYKFFIKSIRVTSLHCFVEEDLMQSKKRIKGKLLCNIWRMMLRLHNNIIVSSSVMRDYYVKYLNKDMDMFSVIPYGIPVKTVYEIDSDAEALLSSIKSKYSLLFGCGSLIQRKGFSQLIDYLSYNQEVALILIGDGDYKNILLEQAQNLGVDNRVFFLGFRNNSYSYYKYCDIFCFTSNSEGFGLAMLESLSMGVPVVCTDLPIYNDYIPHDSVAFFRYGDIESLRHAIDKVLQSPTYYSEKSRTLYESTFTLDQMIDKHIQYYQHLLNQDSHGIGL